MPNAQLLLILDKKKAKELRSSLVGLGYQVLGWVTDNEQAFEIITESKPDLVLVSISNEGGLGGIQFGQQVYSQYDIPVIYISDRSTQATIRRAGGTTPFGYLFDSLNEKEILATIEVALTRHSMERKLRKSKQWLNTIIDSITEGLIAVDMEENIQFINPVAEKLTGKKESDFIGKPLESYLSLVYANSNEPVTFSHAITFFQNQDIRTGFEALLRRVDSTQLPVEIFISALTDRKTQVGMVVTFRDISERKQTMEEIRQYAIRSAAMLRVAEQLNSRLDVKAVLKTVCEVCNNTLSTTATSAFLYDASRKVLVSTTIFVNDEINAYAFDTQSFGRQFEIPNSLILNTLTSKKPVVVIRDLQALDTSNIPYLDKINELDVRSLAIAGIYQKKSLLGILVAQMHGTIRDFTEDELVLLRGLTDQAAIAVANATLFEQVIASRQRQQSLTRRLVDLQESERRGLARELHDQIGQMLTVLQFSLSSLLANSSTEQKKEIVSAQNIVRDLIAQTREISLNLRPSMLDDTGLVLTLIWYFDRYTSQTDIKVEFRHHNILEMRFDTEIEIAIFRIIQESLTNVARHAKTDLVSVSLQFMEEIIKVEIVDQGHGFDLEDVDTTTHMGLSSMYERAYAIGGLLEINSAPAIGTRIHAIIPLSGILERRQHDRKSVTG